MTVRWLVIAWIALSACILFVSTKETIRFAFELSQHGAVSPSYNSSSDYKDCFGEQWSGVTELTVVGQRQQYVLGYHTRLRYIEDNSLLSKSFDPRELFVISTNSNCTILSANAQLQGLYPPGTGPSLNKRQLNTSNPPNDISYFQKERDDLGSYALPNQMTLIPVHNFYLKDHTFELTHPDNCPKMAEVIQSKQSDPKATALLNTFINRFGDKMALLIGEKDQNAFSNYTLTKRVVETLIAEEYDGRTFNKITEAGMKVKDLLDYCHEFMSYDILYIDDNVKESSLISMSLTFSKLIQWIKLKVANDLNSNYTSSDYSPPKFVLYVSYAPSLASLQLFLKSIWTDTDLSYPRYASSAFIELIHNTIEAPTSGNDYLIRYRFNNKVFADIPYAIFIDKASKLIKSSESIKLFCGWTEIKPQLNYHIILACVLGFASLNFIAITVFLYFKLKKQKEKDLIEQAFK